MDTVPIGDVFDAIVRKRGYEPSVMTADATDRANVAESVNRWLRRAYESAWWEPLMVVESRRYREDWSVLTNYAEGDEVWRKTTGLGKYYVSQVGANVGVDPETDTDESHWAEVGSDFVASLELRPLNGTNIGAVDVRKHVFAQDPRAYPGNAPLDGVVMHGDSIVVRGASIPALPWIKYRPETPRFSWTEWDNATAYAIGDRVYVTTSGATSVRQSFVAIAANTDSDPYENTDDWDVVDFPLFLKDYVVMAVAAEERAEDEARHRERALAEQELDFLHERYTDQVGAPRRVRFRVGR